MLAAAALRLAAIEALCPTAAAKGLEGASFPTLAGWRVFDSVTITPEEIDSERPWTPCLSVYTEDTVIARRGGSAPSSLGNAETDLVIVIELAEQADAEGGRVDTDAVINGDATARLTLEALTAQVRAVLVRGPEGAGLRRVMKAAARIRIEPFALPQFGIRYMRNVMVVSCERRLKAAPSNMSGWKFAIGEKGRYFAIALSSAAFRC